MENELSKKLEYLITNGKIKYKVLSPKDEEELAKTNLPQNILKSCNLYYKVDEEYINKDLNFIMMSNILNDMKSVKRIAFFFFILFLISIIMIFFPFF